MADHLDNDELAHIRQIFGKYDINGDGNITFEELAGAMKLLGLQPTQEEITHIINEYDLDGDGHIDFSQFNVSLLECRRKPLPTRQEIQNAFKQFDRDGKGFIDKEEIMYVAEKFGVRLSKEDIEKIMNQIDQDRDGLICLEDFIKVVLE